VFGAASGQDCLHLEFFLPGGRSSSFFLSPWQMKDVDILLRTAVCPAWGALAWFQRDQASGLYGDSPETKKKDDPPLGQVVGVLVAFFVCSIIFYFWPLVKAFTCGNSPTSLGGTGMLWGLLIFVAPPLGLVYLFLGHCVHSEEARQQLMQQADQFQA